jgi:hypothetical protein
MMMSDEQEVPCAAFARGVEWTREFRCLACSFTERDHRLAEAVRSEQATEIEALRAQVSALREWQPIATAPKDGSMVLLYPSGCWTEDEDCGEVGFWDTDFNEWGRAGDVAEDYDGPTHWMPLPAPPSTEEPQP